MKTLVRECNRRTCSIMSLRGKGVSESIDKGTHSRWLLICVSLSCLCRNFIGFSFRVSLIPYISYSCADCCEQGYSTANQIGCGGLKIIHYPASASTSKNTCNSTKNSCERGLAGIAEMNRHDLVHDVYCCHQKYREGNTLKHLNDNHPIRVMNDTL